MAQRKPSSDDGKTQHQRFVEKARDLGASESEDVFKRVLREVATAPVAKAKKVAAKGRLRPWPPRSASS
jgi:hypothetical protein